jgi:Glycine zipper
MNDKTKPITGGSDISDKAKPVDLWDRTKAWANQNRTIAGTLVGGAAGTIIPGLGTLIGAIVGAGVGFASTKEKKQER